MTALQKYFLQYSILLLVVASALCYWNFTQAPVNVLGISWIIFGFFAIVFFSLHLFLVNAENKRPGVFVKRFMGISTIRLFAMLVIIVLYAMSHKQLATLFIWHFLAFYFVFSGFEIATLYNHFKKKN